MKFLPSPELCDRYLHGLNLRLLGKPTQAGLLTVSLPWPAESPRDLSLDGKATWTQPLGEWPEHEGCPRRLLMIADNQGDAPASLSLTAGATAPAAEPPVATLVTYEECPEPEYAWERSYVELAYGGKQVRLAMGLRHAGEVHWWEACGLEVLSESPACRIVRVAGSIPRDLTSAEFIHQHVGYVNPLLHVHHWLSGHLYLRLHANGVCEVFARHINSKYADDGLDLTDVVPVVGFYDPEQRAVGLPDTWDGSCTELDLGGVKCDMTEVARLATRAQPGAIGYDGQFLVWQPYMGAELFGGICAGQRLKDDFILHASEKKILRGMARTLRFSISLGDRSPKIARYLAPYWWYGACCELYAMPYLPVSDQYDSVLEDSRDYLVKNIVRRGYEDGSVPRHAAREPEPGKRYEPGWEGDIPMAQMFQAWRTGDEDDYQSAMRSIYHFTDVIVDHAVKLVRMHGYPPIAFAQPMYRVLGTLEGYLENGDPYLLDTAEAIIEGAHRVHLNSWPRLAVGRDACYLRGALMLYRFTNNRHFLAKAREGIRAVVLSQRAEGNFGDQGGGSGLHQWGAYITKPWMGLLATSPLMDYIDLIDDDEDVRQCVKRFADWLLKVRWRRNGIYTWSYQHDFRGKPDYYDFYSGKWLKIPSESHWHQDHFARVLGWATLTTGDPAYADAWAESLSTCPPHHGDHGVSASLQCIPWIQAMLWRARPDNGGIVTDPLDIGPLTPANGKVYAPGGMVEVSR